MSNVLMQGEVLREHLLSEEEALRFAESKYLALSFERQVQEMTRRLLGQTAMDWKMFWDAIAIHAGFDSEAQAQGRGCSLRLDLPGRKVLVLSHDHSVPGSERANAAAVADWAKQTAPEIDLDKAKTKVAAETGEVGA